ncbi:MAG: UDP-N-acetylmuramoyl-L-alanyl-D-glutamate--2,6-diaminopimelate ligase, partial [Gammaproteobacteria bacterium]
VARGAVAVLAERPLAEPLLVPGGARLQAPETAPIPVLVMADLKQRIAGLAARFYGNPGDTVRCLGVTGTNGKTSIAHYLADLASRVGHPCGYMGTIGVGRVGALESAALTTADPVTVQRELAALVASGCTWAALEVSSHALDQDRVVAVPFRVAAFSNLSRDHLDYHGDMTRYGAAKARLFHWQSLELAVLNVDDAFGRQLRDGLNPAVRVLTYGRADGPERPDISWSTLGFDRAGAIGRWHTPWGDAELRLPVHAEFSVANAAVALAVLCDAGVPLEQVAHAAGQLDQVPGRMEHHHVVGRPLVVIDFAHTPDALEQVLRTLKPRAEGRLICVFGCGGDRDRGKRPLMAAAADRVADELWLTSDNPRSEAPDAIIADMRAGLSGRIPTHEQVDRRAAIAAAIGSAGPADLVLIAGKGHEAYQDEAGVRRPFSDRAVVADCLTGAAA